MALQQDFLVKNGMVVRNTATISTIDSFLGTSTDLISAPILDLNFTSGTLDPRISFSRPSGASYVDRDGYIKYATANQPRFDYSPNNTGTVVGLLLEEQRTNLLPNSTKFAGWNNNPNLTITDNSVIAPDGTLSAAVTNSTGGGTRYRGTAAATSGTAYTYSIYFNPQDPTKQFRCYVDGNLGAGNTFNSAWVDVVPSTRAVTLYSLASTGTVTVAGNGWYRMSVTFIPLSNQGINCHVYPIDPTPTGWWGAQTEQGSFPTSFIPTDSAQVTRASDDARITGSAFNQFWLQNYKTQGSVYSEFVVETPGSAALINLGSAGVWGLSCSTDVTYNGLGLRLNPPSPYGDQIQFLGRAYNATSVNLASGQESTPPYYIIPNKIYKDVCAWDQYTMYHTVCDSINTVTNGTYGGLNNLNTLQIGAQSQGGAGYLILCGWIRRLKIFSTRLPNTQMLALTSSTSYTGQNFNNLAPRTTYTANTSNFTVQQGVVVRANLEVPDIDKLYVTTLTRPTQQPSLNLNFLKGQLDPRIQFTRSSGATYVGADGYIKYIGNNTPRFDYSSTSTGTCLGLLIEEQRTNYIPYSNDWTQYQTITSATVTVNTIQAPDGSWSGATLTSNITGFSNTALVQKWNPTGISTSTLTWCISLYVKQGTSPTVGLNFAFYNGTTYQDSQATLTWADLSISTSGGINSGSMTYGVINAGNGWYRLWSTMVNTYAAPGVVGRMYVRGLSGGNILGEYTYLWGMQIEQGTFPTSYIPTGSATVTRAVDYTSITGQNLYSWYNPLQGTIYTESDSITTATQTGAILDISDISDSSRISIYRQSDKQPVVQYYIPDPVSNVQIGLGAIWTDLSVRKLGTSYSANNFYIASNAVTSSTLTAGAVPGNISRVSIGSFTSGASPANGHIRRVVYYPVRLSNTATYALTIL